ncbi:SDR family oxidoreductase [[Mycobacterium] burgundiense]|uniref:SDR family oxidoreductase n=1 Tax=[Mycobacterium] burgundiense TaxID=3064286 RepID=A0ABM9LZZ5_9MYCO|nr:SDR family oxidoreductase [Mycolicibacterium sp. MU0053]CAJ1507683.1 SDR family oxidoreductase [Mycolicibacterium sp. MU0053]
MKVTVMGASGLIGSKVVDILRKAEQQVVAASRDSGADVLTGAGLAEALAGSDVLVDVTNSPSFADAAVLEFFITSARNLVAAMRAAGARHYVALSIVGLEDLPDSGYMRAKVAQEAIIAGSGLPYTIVRATQFQEFADAIVAGQTADGEVRVPDALIQPIAATEVAAAVAEAAVAEPRNGVLDIGGPDKITFAELARIVLARQGADTPVVVDPGARYFGAALARTSLVTGADAVLGNTPFG